MAEKEKSSLYLLSIVGIVAVVGIVILILGGGQNAVVVPTEIGEEETLAGEAITTTKLTTTKPSTLGKPDLEPLGFTPSVNTADNEFNLLVEVTNNGKKKVSAGKSIEVYVSIDFYDTRYCTTLLDTAEDTVTITLSDDLDSGETVSGTARLEIPGVYSEERVDSFWFGYTIVVDPNEKISESDEDNNEQVPTGPYMVMSW